MNHLRFVDLYWSASISNSIALSSQIEFRKNTSKWNRTLNSLYVMIGCYFFIALMHRPSGLNFRFLFWNSVWFLYSVLISSGILDPITESVIGRAIYGNAYLSNLTLPLFRKKFRATKLFVVLWTKILGIQMSTPYYLHCSKTFTTFSLCFSSL